MAQPLDVPRANWTMVDPLAEWKEPQINVDYEQRDRKEPEYATDKGFLLVKDNKISRWYRYEFDVERGGNSSEWKALGILRLPDCQVAAAASAPETSLRPTPLASRGARKSNGNVHLTYG